MTVSEGKTQEATGEASEGKYEKEGDVEVTLRLIDQKEFNTKAKNGFNVVLGLLQNIKLLLQINIQLLKPKDCCHFSQQGLALLISNM